MAPPQRVWEGGGCERACVEDRRCRADSLARSLARSKKQTKGKGIEQNGSGKKAKNGKNSATGAASTFFFYQDDVHTEKGPEASRLKKEGEGALRSVLWR